MPGLTRVRVGRSIEHIARDYERFLPSLHPWHYPLSRQVYKEDVRFAISPHVCGSQYSITGLGRYQWALWLIRTMIRWRYRAPSLIIARRMQPSPDTLMLHWQLRSATPSPPSLALGAGAPGVTLWEGYSVYRFDYDYLREEQSSDVKAADLLGDGRVVWHRIERITPPPGWLVRAMLACMMTPGSVPPSPNHPDDGGIVEPTFLNKASASRDGL